MKLFSSHDEQPSLNFFFFAFLRCFLLVVRREEPHFPAKYIIYFRSTEEINRFDFSFSISNVLVQSVSLCQSISVFMSVYVLKASLSSAHRSLRRKFNYVFYSFFCRASHNYRRLEKAKLLSFEVLALIKKVFSQLHREK